MLPPTSFYFFFFFNDTATTEIYTLSLHDALPIPRRTASSAEPIDGWTGGRMHFTNRKRAREIGRHTSELQSQSNLVCRLLLEKKKKINKSTTKNKKKKKQAKLKQ